VRPDLALVRVVFEREGLEKVYLFGSTKLRNGKHDTGFPKYPAVEIQKTAFHAKVFHALTCLPLFAKVILDASRLAGTEASCIDHAVRFEQSPEQVVCDLSVLQKRDEPLRCGRVGPLDIAYQEVEMIQV